MRPKALVLLLAGPLTFAACGDGKDRASDGRFREYCQVTRSIFRGQQEPPSDQEMDRWEAAAPDEIGIDVKAAAAAYRELNDAPQPDFARLEAEPLIGSFDRIEAFNEETCGIKAE